MLKRVDFCEEYVDGKKCSGDAKTFCTDCLHNVCNNHENAHTKTTCPYIAELAAQIAELEAHNNE